MDNQKTIYDLELHETLKINKYNEISRVPGGWIYNKSIISPTKGSVFMTSTFVPLDNEFRPPINMPESKHKKEDVQAPIKLINTMLGDAKELIDSGVETIKREGDSIDVQEDINHFKFILEILKKHSK